MPANTGNVAISNIVHHNLPDAKDAASGPMNRWKAMLTMMGTVTMLRMLLTAVKLTESGTSPRAILVQRFEVGPPGHAARIMMPTASEGGERKRTSQ